MLVYGALVPHPPIIVPEVGGAEREAARRTISAMETVAKQIREVLPDTIVVFSPHGPLFQDGLAIRGDAVLRGDLRRFGADLSWEWENDGLLMEEITKEIKEEGIPVIELTADLAAQYRISSAVDHGVTVPLSFLGDLSYSLVATGMTLLPWHKQYILGAAIGRAVKNSRRKVAVIASGDLSHALKQGGATPYDPCGAEFDQTLVRLLQEHRLAELFQLKPAFVEKAAECGFRTLLMLLGVFAGFDLNIRVLSYEGPYGVGYAVAEFTPGRENPQQNLRFVLEKRQKDAVLQRRAAESPLARLARLTVERHLTGVGEAGTDEDLPEKNAEFQQAAGTFVSIKKNGALRGCIGTIYPTQPTLREEVKHNAIAAAFHDPRFDPIGEEELEELVYSVDVLAKPEPVSALEELDPRRYGVIVRQGGRTGLLLPNLEGVDTVEEQIRIAKQKAGIGPHEEVELEKFEVKRYE